MGSHKNQVRIHDPADLADVELPLQELVPDQLLKKVSNHHFLDKKFPRKGGTGEEQKRNHRPAQKCSRSAVSGSGCEYRTLVSRLSENEPLK